MEVVAKLLELAGIERDRVQLRRVSAAEGALFTEYVKEISQKTTEMGPFDAEAKQLELRAIKRALSSRRLRWLYGMEKQLEVKENVYGEKTDPELMSEIMDESIKSEFYKAMITEALMDGPLSVREIADKTNIPVYTVSLRLNELEREGKAEFDSHVGTTAKFANTAA